ncbi:MAG: hypothetical protein MSH08_03705 [Ezakiella sp.]|nr:hypothetical protein [Ezakiella sp.]MDD7471626.1 hypothetical protein [Bacillota bacterium]MDY3923410.1 hypothetical protein [Ezakiella sp.]
MEISWNNRRKLDLSGLSTEDKIKIIRERLYMFPEITFKIIKRELELNYKNFENDFDEEFLNGYKSVMSIVERFSNTYVGDISVYNEYVHSPYDIKILSQDYSDETTLTKLITKLDKEPISTYYELDRILNINIKKSIYNVTDKFKEGYCRACGTIAASWLDAKEEQNFNNELIFKMNSKEPVRIYDIIKRDQDIKIATMYCTTDFADIEENFNSYF